MFYYYTVINARLKKVRNFYKMSIRDFSKEISYSHGLYGLVETGKNKPTDRIIQLIVSKFNVNKDWLLSGKDRKSVV